MPTIGPATIIYDQSDVDPVPHGEVNWVGIAPTTKVVVSEWNHAEKRLIQVDRLTKATVTETETGAKITGTSSELGRKVTLDVTSTRKCC